jgi:hypothetical protein
MFQARSRCSIPLTRVYSVFKLYIHSVDASWTYTDLTTYRFGRELQTSDRYLEKGMDFGVPVIPTNVYLTVWQNFILQIYVTSKPHRHAIGHERGCSLVVRIRDCGSRDPGSTPGSRIFLFRRREHVLHGRS